MAGDRLPAQVASGTAEIDQISSVHARRKSGSGGRRLEKADITLRDHLRPPHPARFRKDLKRFRTVAERARIGFVQPA